MCNLARPLCITCLGSGYIYAQPKIFLHCITCKAKGTLHEPFGPPIIQFTLSGGQRKVLSGKVSSKGTVNPPA